MLDHSSQVQRHPLAERGRDEHDTPSQALRALLETEALGAKGTKILEPAAGKPDREVIAGYIRDALAGSLSDAQAAVSVARHVAGAASVQLLAAAIGLLREQAAKHAEELDEVRADLVEAEHRLKEENAALRFEVAALRARLPRAPAARAIDPAKH